MSTIDSTREAKILQELRSTGSVHVSDLAERLSVSAVTIRKDLDSLEQRSMLKRVHGGAVQAAPTDEGSFAHRLTVSYEAKRAIAVAAAEIVQTGDVISLDSSTSCFLLAQQLVDRRDLIVVTYGLHVATFLMEESSAMVVMPGGVLRRSSGSLVGDLSDPLEGRGRIDKAFFGIRSLSRQYGLMELAVDETGAKRSQVRSANQIYAMFTAEKTHEFALHSFASPELVTGLYTDAPLPDDDAAAWAAHGVAVNVIEEAENRQAGEPGDGS